MAHHVAVGEVEDNHVVIAALNALDGLLRDLGGAHLRLEIVGGHLGGGDQAAVLAGEHLLVAAVEEEGHVGVLLRLGNAQLGIALLGDILAENVGQLPVGEGDEHVGHGGIVLGGADEGHGEVALLPLHVGKGGIHETAGDLPGPVGAEVGEDDGVALPHAAVLGAHDGLHKLVGDAGIIGFLHPVHRVGVLHALAPGHGVVGPLHPVPALVPVHGVVAAHDGGHLAHADFFALFHKLFHIFLAGGGGHIPAVQEAVDVHPAQPPLPGHLQQGEDVGDVAVDAAVGQQAHDVEGAAALLAVVHGLDIGLVLKEAAVLDGPADAGEILEHHPAGADVGVTHLGVAHLALGQTHVQTGGRQLAAGILRKNSIQIWLAGSGDGIALLLLRQAKAIHNNQGSRCLTHNYLESKLLLHAGCERSRATMYRGRLARTGPPCSGATPKPSKVGLEGKEAAAKGMSFAARRQGFGHWPKRLDAPEARLTPAHDVDGLLLLVGRVHDLHEIGGLQGRAADQAAVRPTRHTAWGPKDFIPHRGK